MARGRKNTKHEEDEEVGALDASDSEPTMPSTSLPVGDVLTAPVETTTPPKRPKAPDLPDAPEPSSTWNKPVEPPAPPIPPSWGSVTGDADGSDNADADGSDENKVDKDAEGDTSATPASKTSSTKDVPASADNSANLPVPRDSHPEIHESNDELLPVPMEAPQLAPHIQELKIAAQDALIERMGSRLYDRTLTEEQIESYVINELGGWLFEQQATVTDDERDQLTAELLNDVLRHGPIEPFLGEEDITEIMVNGLACIYVEKNGKLIRTTSHFLTEAHLRQVIERIVSKIGRRIDESSPMVDARLPDGSRVNAVIPPLAVDGPSLTIRKFSKEALTVEDLISFGTLSTRSVDFLSAAVRGRMNILVSGGTGTGKTTLLNVLSNFIPEDERIVTLEDAVELQLKQDHLVRLESRPPNVEGKGQITIRDLVRNSLRMRPDRVIIGECRGGEALDMLQAMNTGHDGSLSTLHANGPRDAIARLETLCLMAGMDLPVRAIREQIASAVDLLVHVSRLRDGTRRVTHVSEVVGMEDDAVVMSDIYTFDFDSGLDIDGRYTGELQPTGIVPSLVSKIREYGEELDNKLFDPEEALAGGKS